MHMPSKWLQSFSLKSVVQKCNSSIPLLSSTMWDCRKIGLLEYVFLVATENGDGLPNITVALV